MPSPDPVPASGKARPRGRRRRVHRRDSRPPAQAPGMGGHVGERRMHEISISVLDYSAAGIRERQVASGSECLAFEGRDSPVWIRVTGLHEAERLRGLLEAYQIHPLVQDDILNTNQGPKLEDFGDYLFITSKLVSSAPPAGIPPAGPAGSSLSSGPGEDPRNAAAFPDRTGLPAAEGSSHGLQNGGTGPGRPGGNGGTAENTDPWRTDVQHFSLILTRRVLISFQEAPSPVFEPVLQRLRQGKGRLNQQGPDYLAWALLDALLDHYLVALDDLAEEVGRMDETLTDPGGQVDLEEIHQLRARTNFLHRTMRPMREVVAALQHHDGGLLQESLSPFLRDLYDHAWRAIETADHLREAVTGIREYYHAILSQRLNETMKVLAAISTIFLPLSFLAGVYGMNFENMPELRHPWGYPVIWGVFIVLGAGMLVYFRRHHWI